MYKYLHFGVRLHLRERNSGSVPPLGYNHVMGNTRGGYRSPKTLDASSTSSFWKSSLRP